MFHDDIDVFHDTSNLGDFRTVSRYVCVLQSGLIHDMFV